MQHLIFDLDDTLLDTSHVYWQAREAFIGILTRHGIVSAEAIDLFETVDEENIKIHGLTPERYGYSMHDTCMQLIRASRLKGSHSILDELESCSRIVPNQIPELIDGALALLEWAADNYHLSLLTRGIESFQLEKIHFHGLDRFFQTISIVEKKGVEEFENLLNRLGAQPENCWIVGDSVKSDINPSIQLNIKCILYLYSHHTYYWQQEYGVNPRGSFYLARTLDDVRNILNNPHDFPLVSSL